MSTIILKMVVESVSKKVIRLKTNGPTAPYGQAEISVESQDELVPFVAGTECELRVTSQSELLDLEDDNDDADIDTLTGLSKDTSTMLPGNTIA